MEKKQLISFDMDGTLIDSSYTTSVWEMGIPELYAEKHGIDITRATSLVRAEYERIGDGALEWYDISYWFKYFGLSGSWEELLEIHRDKIKPYPEVKETIESLGESFDLIVTSNAAREFVEKELTDAGIEIYFSKIFSATSDFGQVKKTPQFYRLVCDNVNIHPSLCIHVGDHYEFDYLVPKKLGMEAVYLDRKSEKPEHIDAVKDLREFADLVMADRAWA